MKTCIYPGTFDPFTTGHLDVLKRGCAIFDKVIVGLLKNSSKTPMFSLQERENFIRKAAQAEGITNFDVISFDGLLVEFAERQGASALLRGLRAVTDFEYELQMAAMNKKLKPELETMFLMTSTQYSFLSSSIVKEIGAYGGCIKGLVPEVNRLEIAERLVRQ